MPRQFVFLFFSRFLLNSCYIILEMEDHFLGISEPRKMFQNQSMVVLYSKQNLFLNACCLSKMLKLLMIN